MAGRAFLLAVLVLCGAAWGLTQPLTKIAVSGGYRHFGLIFWQLVISAGLLLAITWMQGKRIPFGRTHCTMYVVIALIGTVLPNSASFEAARHLPAGVMSISIATVPMMAFPIAILLGTDRFGWRRMLGLLCGMLGVLLLIGPEASLPDRAMVAFIPLALVAPLFYGIEGNVIAKFGTAGLDPIQLLCGASIVGAGLVLPLTLLSGQWIDPRPPYLAPDLALIASSGIHAVVYTTFFWMIGRAGPVFAAQVSYLVTGFGVLWAMLLLSESYSGWIWLALAVMFAGLFLVQPRGQSEQAR